VGQHAFPSLSIPLLPSLSLSDDGQKKADFPGTQDKGQPSGTVSLFPLITFKQSLIKLTYCVALC